MLFTTNAVSGEHTIDLGLSDKSLKHVFYKPQVKSLIKKSVNIESVDRSYFVFFPKNVGPVMPVLVALHGAGRSGLSMIDTWQTSADKHSFIIVAPDGINNQWEIQRDEASFITAAIKDALSQRKIKSAKLYLFGHSNGAKQAIAQAARHPGMFHRVAAHAGTLPLRIDKSIVNVSPKSVKVAMFLGDSDHIFSVDSGRQTVRWLSSIGIESDFYILKDHSHWYYNDAHRINESIWSFLSKI